MNGDRVIPLLLVACSLFVLGTMAASLDATVTSTPRDGIDVDTDSLPFVGDGVSEVAVSYDEGTEGQQAGSAQSQSGAGDAGGGGADQAEGSTGSSGGQSSDVDAGRSASAGGEDGGVDPSRSLLAWLFLVLALLAVVAAAAYAYRRRDRIVELLWALAARYGLVSATDAVPGAMLGDDEEAATVVERAWAEMLRRSGARCAASDTPRECATAAIDAGVDREPVEELTSLYERVRYGQRAVTPEHASRALGLLREVPHRHDGPPGDSGWTPRGLVTDPGVAGRGPA